MLAQLLGPPTHQVDSRFSGDYALRISNQEWFNPLSVAINAHIAACPRMIAVETLPRMSVADYLAFEQESEVHHELVDGYLYAMTGASDRHEEIAANLLAALHGHLQGSGCRVYGSNLKIRAGNDFLYPDLFVRCAVERGDPYFKTDPTLVVEVLSPSTQRYDRGDKRMAYQSLSTLKEFVLVAQDEPRIEIHRRTSNGWEREVHRGLNGILPLRSVGLQLALSLIYA